MPEVRVEFFDDEAIVFNPSTWETHVLNAAAAVVLEELQSRNCSDQEVAEVLSDVLDASEALRAGEHARRLIEDLVSLRLVVPCTDEGR